MRRRRPDVEELLPLEEDNPGPAPDGRIVEVGPGRSTKRRDVGLLVAVVALVAGVGFLGDDGGGHGGAEQDAEAITSTTRRRTTATPSRRPSTTTTLPTEPVVTFTEGTGPVAGGAPTGSAIVSTQGDEIVVVDLDTGRSCEIEVPGARSGALWVGRGSGDRANVNSNRGALTVTSACAVQELGGSEVTEVLPSDRPGHVWKMRHLGQGLELVEEADDGTPSGRQVHLPAWTGTIHPVAGGFVTDVFGSVTLVPTDGGAAREIAKGFSIAAGRDRVAVVECRAFDCDVAIVGIDGRELLRRESARPAVGWQTGALSPDGRWLAYLTLEDEPVPQAVLVDLRAGEERELGPNDGSPIAFTATSSHVALRTPLGLVVVPVDGGDPVAVDDQPGAGQPFAVIDRAAGSFSGR